jgi:hypothetical protein
MQWKFLCAASRLKLRFSACQDETRVMDILIRSPASTDVDLVNEHRDRMVRHIPIIEDVHELGIYAAKLNSLMKSKKSQKGCR